MCVCVCVCVCSVCVCVCVCVCTYIDVYTHCIFIIMYATGLAHILQSLLGVSHYSILSKMYFLHDQTFASKV